MASSVRSHLKRKLHNHLENPPEECLCHKSKAVDRVRRKLADMTAEEDSED